MSRSAAPDVATPQVMARTLAVFYAFGGCVGLLAVLGSEADPVGRWAVGALGVNALLFGALLARFGERLPRAAFHVPVAGAAVLIALAAFLAPDPVTAVVCASIMAFVGVDAYFFFRRPHAFAHLTAAVVIGTGALVARGDVSPATALALHLVVVALGTVTRGLVVRASSANLDPLTGLVNRRGFDQALQELMPAAFRSGERFSVALLDLDHFKQVNDTLGHDAGDRLLHLVAETWSRELPAGAVLARHGGDEFALLLPQTTGPIALATVERLSALHPDVGVSCGVAQHLWGESAAQLMRRADTALYAVKAAGRGKAALHGVPEPPTTGELPRTSPDGRVPGLLPLTRRRATS